MKTRWICRTLPLAALVALFGRSPITPAAEAAEAKKVLQVIAVQLKGDEATYLDRVKKLTGINERLKTGATVRVWRATLAGEDAGTIYVGIEYADLESFAKGMVKTQGDDEYRKMIEDLDKSGIREIIGNSLLAEITP